MRIFSLIICLLFLGSCLPERVPPPPTRAELAKQRPIPNSAREVDVEPFVSQEPTESGTPGQVSYGVEMSWEIPAEPVDAFVLYLGNSPENLNTEIHLKISDLQVVADNKYRYVIKPVESSEPMYVSLAAQFEGKISPRSEVQKIEPSSMMPNP